MHHSEGKKSKNFLRRWHIPTPPQTPPHSAPHSAQYSSWPRQNKNPGSASGSHVQFFSYFSTQQGRKFVDIITNYLESRNFMKLLKEVCLGQETIIRFWDWSRSWIHDQSWLFFNFSKLWETAFFDILQLIWIMQSLVLALSMSVSVHSYWHNILSQTTTNITTTKAGYMPRLTMIVVANTLFHSVNCCMYDRFCRTSAELLCRLYLYYAQFCSSDSDRLHKLITAVIDNSKTDA